MTGSIGLAMMLAAAVAAPAMAATPPKPLASTGPWQVDYSPDACLLGRRFVDGKKEVVLGWRALPLEENVEIIVTRASGDRRFALGDAVIAVAGRAPEDTQFESFPTTKPGYQSIRLRAPATMFEGLDTDVVLTIAPKGLRAMAFALAGPRKAFAALGTCNDETLKNWGIDAGERERIAVQPEAADDRARWITANDYPRSVVATGRQGTTAMLFRIAATGRVDQCRAVVTSGSKELDDAACAALTKRARYTPARDAAGQPMAVHRVRRVTWRLPGVWNAGR